MASLRSKKSLEDTDAQRGMHRVFSLDSHPTRYLTFTLKGCPTFLADVLHFFPILYSVDRCITVLNGQVNLFDGNYLSIFSGTLILGAQLMTL